MIELGLSNRRRLPVFRLFDWTFAPWQIRPLLKVRRKARQLQLSFDQGTATYSLLYKGQRLKLRRPHAVCVVTECDLWEKFYAPLDLNGKIVLDVGAGSLETAAFFLSKGASKVYAIEDEPEALELAEQNIRRNDLSVEILPGRFYLQQLKNLPFDYMKMDIEGAEEALLGLPKLDFSCIIEAHGSFGFWSMEKKLRGKFPELKPIEETRTAQTVLLTNVVV